MAERVVMEELDVQEAFFERGWTDGLPIVAPTPDRVQAMLDLVLADDPDTLIGFLPARGRGVTLEKAAINAVMAGCRPEYFPVVVAALEAMFDEAFNLHTVLTSTGGAALCAIVSGPIAREIGMNARHNALGQGNRANATIGRALRLVAMNVLGSKPGESDASSFGHPGKFTLCFAEDPPPAPWEPLRVELGYFRGGHDRHGGAGRRPAPARPAADGLGGTTCCARSPPRSATRPGSRPARAATARSCWARSTRASASPRAGHAGRRARVRLRAGAGRRGGVGGDGRAASRAAPSTR